MTNAAGQITRYPRYNPHGQVLQQVDPNGQLTSYTYDLRQRLTSATAAGRTTRYDWFPTGLLKQVTEPDGSYVAHEYDDAHRLVAVRNQLNHRIRYTLDNAVERIAEDVVDPQGQLQRQLARVHDALGRVQQSTGRE